MVNKVVLVGNAGQDPEVRHLESGVAVANFNLATNETYKDKNGEKVTQTEWHRIVLWRGLAEVAEKYVKKGELLYIEGRLRTRSWDDKDGNKKYTTEVFADAMKMLGRKPAAPGEGQEEAVSQTQDDGPDVDAGEQDDLPF
ncbi:MAG: single-stranded DNA-binding protein [Marinilabiliales bacterium]|nr:MAG: single-stranded DNA-binding protein [Marinilabiliales bacterium]